jgi:hypothetical protein
VDAWLRNVVGGICDSRCRNWSILAAFSADRGGVRIEDPKTGQSWPLTRRAGASAADSSQSASDRDPRSASKRDPFVRFERLARFKSRAKDHLAAASCARSGLRIRLRCPWRAPCQRDRNVLWRLFYSAGAPMNVELIGGAYSCRVRYCYYRSAGLPTSSRNLSPTNSRTFSQPLRVPIESTRPTCRLWSSPGAPTSSRAWHRGRPSLRADLRLTCAAR